MSSLVLLLTCLLLGIAVARWAQPPESLARNLNWWVLNIALPALVLEMLPRLQFEPSLWFLPAAMWLVFFGSWILFVLLGRQLGWSRSTVGALVLTAGLCNTSFVGFPLIEALRGKEAIKYAAVADQFGCFLAVAIGGSIVAALYSGGRAHPRLIVRKVLSFTPFLATLTAVAVGIVGGWPPMVDEVLTRLGSTLTPLALFSVGLQLRFQLSAARMPALATALGWKLALAPGLIFAVGRLLDLSGPSFDISVLQAAMAPMITGAILAEQHNLDPPLANMVLGLGILLSMLTVPAWNLWL